MDSRSNPYADYGTIITGARFIGRESDVRTIRNRLLGFGGFGSLALIGMPRVGKTSLANKALLEDERKLISRGIVAVTLTLGAYESADRFFSDLISECHEKMDKEKLLSERVHHIAEATLAATPIDRFSHIKRFFAALKSEGLRVIAVLDEFDSARYLFSGQRQYLHWLRELAANPEFKIGMLIISKRELRQIAARSSGEDATYWHNVFMDHHLSLFSESELEVYYEHLASNGANVDSNLKQQIRYYCGTHPFYLDAFAFFIVNGILATGQIELDAIAGAISTSFQQEFGQLAAILSEDGRLDKLLQILFGPLVNVTVSDVNLFCRYGLISKGSNSAYDTFSPYLRDYLRLLAREVDLWPLWSETEKLLRWKISLVLSEKYGEQWIDVLEKSKPNLKSKIGELRAQQKKEREKFGERASTRLLDYAYPIDLYSIISSEWSFFEGILGKDRGYWNQRFTLLSKIRTPLAHNRDLALLDYERNITEGYCKEIIYLLRNEQN